MTRTQLSAYWRLMRMDKPIGIYLLLWPTVWALWLAADGLPDGKTLLIFVAGVVVMRAAGCVINDYADRHVDGSVERTNTRPIVSGEVSPRQALYLFCALVLVAFVLVLQLNWQTIGLSLVAVALASVYPFMKRVTYLPQFVLGAAFSWGIPMASMAISGQLPIWVWLLYGANLCWTVAYDTQYAMVDREDDIRIGVKSTAILFGQYDTFIIGLLQFITLVLLVWVGQVAALSPVYFTGVTVAAGLFIYQQWLIGDRTRDKCFKAFLTNHYAGMLVGIGIFGHYSLI